MIVSPFEGSSKVDYFLVRPVIYQHPQHCRFIRMPYTMPTPDIVQPHEALQNSYLWFGQVCNPSNLSFFVFPGLSL